jgi:MFS family permease
VMVNVARSVGPAVAGVLFATVGSGWCFLVNAVSFVFVVAGLRALHADELTPAPIAARAKGQLVEGFRYVARRPLLRNALIMMAVVGCLTYEFQTTLPLIAGDTFHGNSATYGFFTASMGVGAVVGGLVAAGRRGRSPRRMVNTLLGFAAVLVVAALAPDRIVEEIALLFVGAGMVTFLALANTTIQLESAPEMRGRVMSLWSVAFLGTTPIGGPLVGFIGGTFGARYSLGVGAAAALGAGLFGLWSFRHRDMTSSGEMPASGDPTAAGAAVASGASVSGASVSGASVSGASVSGASVSGASVSEDGAGAAGEGAVAVGAGGAATSPADSAR